jgi:DNA repair protein RadA/Sms
LNTGHLAGGLAVFAQDVFINAVGGVCIYEPGQVRSAQRGQKRLREAVKLGFIHTIVPKANRLKHKIEGMEVIGVDRVEQAVAYCRGG